MTDLANVLAASDAVAQALATVPDPLGKRVHGEPGEALNALPALVISPPALTFSGYGNAVDVTFLVYLVTSASAGAVAELLRWLPDVVTALGESDAVVLRADPGVYLAGAVSLPCYEITIDFPL